MESLYNQLFLQFVRYQSEPVHRCFRHTEARIDSKDDNFSKPFMIIYITLPHNLIKDKLVDLIERTFQREGSLYIACNDRIAFFTSDAV